MHDIEMGKVSPEFVRCWQAAGTHLGKVAEIHGETLYWMRAHLEPPFLDHLSFRFGNQVFFIRLMDVEERVSVPGNIKGLKSIAEGWKGHACILWMREGPEGWVPDRGGWGLVDPVTEAEIDPAVLVTDELIEMTDWELHDFAVVSVRQALEKEGRQIMSAQGNPEVDPSLWFIGDEGPEWVVVRAERYPAVEALPPVNWTRIAENCEQLSSRGNFASVVVASANDPFAGVPGTETPLWRGGPMFIKYEGLVPRSV